MVRLSALTWIAILLSLFQSTALAVPPTSRGTADALSTSPSILYDDFFIYLPRDEDKGIPNHDHMTHFREDGEIVADYNMTMYERCRANAKIAEKAWRFACSKWFQKIAFACWGRAPSPIKCCDFGQGRRPDACWEYCAPGETCVMKYE